MQLKIHKWGNGAAIRLNKALLKQISSGVGENVEAEVKNGGLFIKPVKRPEYTLDEILASCTREKMQLEPEDEQWLNDKPKGKEVW